MSFIKKAVFLSALFLITISTINAKDDFRIESQPLVEEILQALPTSGVLKQKENGFIYLDVSNDFITKVVPLIDHEGIIRPRPTASRSIGAHISVFHESEEVIPDELEMTFNFYIKEVRSFIMHSRDGLKKLWVIAVESEELQKLREKYGLKPLLKGYDFHITIGKQMPSAPDGWEEIQSISIFESMIDETELIYSHGDFVVVENSSLLETALKVDAIGQLKLKGNGFVYLDVSNDYIDSIVEELPVRYSFTPTSTKAKKMGAHISVIYEDEMIKNEIWDMINAGEWFTFTIKELRYVNLKTSSGECRLWLLAVDAPGLQRLRESYGLKPKLKGHDFHITLGKEVIEEPFNSESKIEKNAFKIYEYNFFKDAS